MRIIIMTARSPGGESLLSSICACEDILLSKYNEIGASADDLLTAQTPAAYPHRIKEVTFLAARHLYVDVAYTWLNAYACPFILGF